MLSVRLRSALFVAFAAAVVCPHALAQDRGLGARPPTPTEQAYINAVYSQVSSVAANDLARARVRAEAAAAGISAQSLVGAEALPSVVDNSTLPYFPPIRSQGSQGSCTAWASCYYYDTFTQAMDEGYTVSGGDNNHICSPAFLYPLINGGADNGASGAYAVARLNDVGACSWTLKPYSAADYTSWPSEAAWVNALQNRTQASQYIDGSNASGVTAIKQHLANGNLAVTYFPVYRTFYNNYPADSLGISNGVYYCPDGSTVGGHAVTLIGYDDNKSYLDYRDAQTHYGAFLVANSWGPGWGVFNSTGTGSKGFFWVAYDMFLNGDFGPTAYYNTDRPHYRPALYVAAGINHPERDTVSLRAGAGDGYPWTSYYAVDRDGGGALGISDSARVAVDMSDARSLFPLTAFTAVAAQVQISSSAADSGTVTSADFYEDLDGDGAYTITSSTDPTLTLAPGAWRYATALLKPHYLDLTANCDPTTVASGGSTSLSASSTDSFGHQVATWQWSDGGAGGTFSPSATIANPTYTAPDNTGATDLVIHLQVTATCDGPYPDFGSATADLTVTPLGFFSDVPSDFWAHDQIHACAVAGIVAGFGDSTYRPSLTVDRASMAVYISRALAGGDGNVPSGPATPTFSDVPTDHWAYRHVEYAYAHGIVVGYWNGYHPDETVNRAQMAVFVARAVAGGDTSVPPGPATATFPDVPTSHWAFNYVEYCVAQGIVQGYWDGYHPDEAVNRAQMAVYVQRAFDLPL
jgi:C1A family cysteine protease